MTRRAGRWGRISFSGRSGPPEAPFDGLPEGFRFHDLRHYYASLLISKGLDVKVVQARLRHASPKRHWTRTGTCAGL